MTGAYRTTVDATGDDAGNSGKVSVRRRPDGTITLGAANRRESATVWLTRQQATDIALALMNAARRSYSCYSCATATIFCDGRCCARCDHTPPASTSVSGDEVRNA